MALHEWYLFLSLFKCSYRIIIISIIIVFQLFQSLQLKAQQETPILPKRLKVITCQNLGFFSKLLFSKLDFFRDCNQLKSLFFTLGWLHWICFWLNIYVPCNSCCPRNPGSDKNILLSKKNKKLKRPVSNEITGSYLKRV